MKKSIVFVAIAIAASAGIFAQAAEKAPLPPEVKMPEESVVREYHAAQMNALKTLKDAQVKAGICNQEQADAALAILKAAQSKCKGECILRKGTDMPFGGMHRKHNGGQKYCIPVEPPRPYPNHIPCPPMMHGDRFGKPLVPEMARPRRDPREFPGTPGKERPMAPKQPKEKM